MAVIRNLVVKIAADISSLTKGLQNAQKSIQKVSATFTKAGTKLTASITAPLIALGTASVKVSAQFEQSMANAASVAGATGDEFERMKQIARDMGSKTVFSASEAADALYYMASAGYKVDQMADSIQATLNLASATQSDLAFTTDTVISTLNQFGLEANQAERVTNVFAAAIGNSMANMDKLSNSMGYVGPVANSLGYSIEETTGALAVLYNAGYDGSTAGTALRQSLVALMNPSTAALGVFEELGLTYDEVNPATNDLATVIDRLGAAGMDTAQAMKVFGARAGPGMLALLSAGGDAVRDMTASITGTNKANEMAEVQLDTLSGQWKILKSQLEEVAIQFGDVLIPIIRQFLAKYITPLIGKISGLTHGTKKTIVTIGLLAAAIGPLLLVIGKVIGGVGSLIKIIPMLFSKAGLIIAAISAVVGALVYLWKNNEDFRDAVIKIWGKVKTAILKVVNKLKEWWEKNGQKVLNAVKTALKAMWSVVKTVFNKIYKIAQKVWPIIKGIVLDVVQAIYNFWNTYGSKIVATVKKVCTTLWTAFKAAFENIWAALQRFFAKIQPLWEKIKGLFASLWNTICDLYETLKPIFELIGGLVMTLWGVVSSVVAGVIDALGPFLEVIISVAQAIMEIIQMVCAILRGDWSDAWEHMKNVATNIWDAIKNIFVGIWEFIKGFGESIVSFFTNCGDTIGGIFKRLWEGIKNFFGNIGSGISSACGGIWDNITGLFGNVGDFFKNLFSDGFSWGKNLISNIGDGIKKGWNWVVDGVKGVGQKIKNFLGFGSPTKEGPGHTADEWIPNLMNMMADDMYDYTPVIARAAFEVAETLGLSTSPNRAMVGIGSNPNGDLVNGLLQGMAAMNVMGDTEGKEIVMQIDGQTFARVVMPKLSREYKRNGVKLTEA